MKILKLKKEDSELSYITGIDDRNEISRVKIYPDDSNVYNPAFDITPNKFVESFITEKGIIRASVEGYREPKR